jgi:hypothetical protein
MNHNIERLNLHDTHLISIGRDTQDIILNLSHGYLSDHKEKGVNEAIMFADAVLSFKNVTSEIYRSSNETHNGTFYVIEKPSDFETEYEVIAGNELEANNHFVIQVFRKKFDPLQFYCVEWTIEFDSFALDWKKFVLHRDWLMGSATL